MQNVRTVYSANEVVMYSKWPILGNTCNDNECLLTDFIFTTVYCKIKLPVLFNSHVLLGNANNQTSSVYTTPPNRLNSRNGSVFLFYFISTFLYFYSLFIILVQLISGNYSDWETDFPRFNIWLRITYKTIFGLKQIIKRWSTLYNPTVYSRLLNKRLLMIELQRTVRNQVTHRLWCTE